MDNNIDDFNIETKETNEQTEYYDEKGFSGYKIKENPLMRAIIIGGIIIVVLVIILVVLSAIRNSAKLEDVKITGNDIIYVGEVSDLGINALGSGKLNKVTYTFASSNDFVSVDKTSLSGVNALAKVTGLKTGKASITVKAVLKDKTITKIKDLLVCDRLSDKSLVTDDVSLNTKDTYVIDISLGSNSECYGNISYKSNDNDVASVDKYGKITGVSTGNAVITVSDGINNFEIKVEVK